MVAERASVQLVRKPWGSVDLRPWSNVDHDGVSIGELWFQRTDKRASDPALLMKLLFTTQPLSIQVHPEDDFARSIGLANGKTEAWYILSAAPNSEVAIGLNRQLPTDALRAAIDDSSIVGMIKWRLVHSGDVCSVPAGTIHAIGAGIVLAEIQQRSDATFRIFDYERHRELHVDKAVAVASSGPVEAQSPPVEISEARTALIANRHFVLEKIKLQPDSQWLLHAKRETWMLVLEGQGVVGAINVSKGEVVFVEDERIDINVGPDGFEGLLAYTGPHPDIGLLTQHHDRPAAAMGVVVRALHQEAIGHAQKQSEAQT